MNYQEAGRWMEAIPLLQDLLRVQQAKLGPEHQNTIRTMNSLAGAYHGAGRLGAAVPLQEQALALVRKNLGPDHPDTLIGMNNLSGLYREEGRTNEAIALSEEAFNLAKAKLGPEHPDTLSIMNGLALGYRDAGRVNEAILLHEQVLTATTTKLGMNHPGTVATLGNLLADYLTAGRRAEADSLLRQVLSPAVAGSPQSLAPLRVRADYLARTGQWREAAEDLKRLTDLKSSNIGDWHYLAIILIQTGDLDGYRDHCRKTLERFANASDALTTFRVAKDCLLQPDSRLDPELAVRMIDNALLAGTNSVQWPMFESTKALAEYRQGHFAKALEWAEAARSFHPTFPCHCWRPGLEAEAEAILAMAHHQLQQRELARTTLAAAQDLVGHKLPNIGSTDLGPDWLDSIVSRTLLREATALIGSHPEEREAGK